MRLRTWGILLMIAGALLVGGALLGLSKARAWEAEGRASCASQAAAGDAWCGEGRSYALALAIALLPMLTLPASLLLLGGTVLIALDVALSSRQTVI